MAVTTTAAGIDITATQSITAPPGDAVRPQPPPTLTAPHLPAVAPHNPSTCAPTLTTPTPTPLNTPPQQSSIRRPLNRWRPPPNFQALSPTDQLLDWFEFHANQLDTPNRPQHQYIANLLSDCNITYKDITDFRQYAHAKWNETTRQYDQFQYNAISLPYLNTKATTPEPPAVSRATSTHREVAHINAGHTGPLPTFYAKVGFYPAHSTLPTTLAFLHRASASPAIHPTTKASSLALSTTLGNSTKTPTQSSLHSSPGAQPPNTLPVAKNKP